MAEVCVCFGDEGDGRDGRGVVAVVVVVVEVVVVVLRAGVVVVVVRECVCVCVCAVCGIWGGGEKDGVGVGAAICGPWRERGEMLRRIKGWGREEWVGKSLDAGDGRER